MKPMIALVAWLLALPMLASAPARAQDAGRQTCPSGYTLIAEVCVSDATGDVVLPRDRK
jgi:hypothetical protein